MNSNRVNILHIFTLAEYILHIFTPNDVGVFLLKMCKIDRNVYFT